MKTRAQMEVHIYILLPGHTVETVLSTTPRKGTGSSYSFCLLVANLATDLDCSLSAGKKSLCLTHQAVGCYPFLVYWHLLKDF
jgi:hypothetical protein